jgi:hypothetical protein
LSILTLFAVSLLLWSCGADHHDHDHDSTEASTTHGLSTDDGKKWPMDEHTRSMFTVMAKKTSTFDGTAQDLGASLQTDLGKLIDGCTMTGAAHDQLHKFLMLYIPAIKELAEIGGDKNLLRIKELLETYPQYFE